MSDQTERIHANGYAKKLFEGHKQYMHIATEAFRAGETNAIFVIRSEQPELYKELEELRLYKKETEEMLNDPEQLSQYLNGL